MITFRFIRKGFNDTGRIYAGKIIERYANGYKVERCGQAAIVLFKDIEIIEIK